MSQESDLEVLQQGSDGANMSSCANQRRSAHAKKRRRKKKADNKKNMESEISEPPLKKRKISFNSEASKPAGLRLNRHRIFFCRPFVNSKKIIFGLPPKRLFPLHPIADLTKVT